MLALGKYFFAVKKTLNWRVGVAIKMIRLTDSNNPFALSISIEFLILSPVFVDVDSIKICLVSISGYLFFT